jgi:hypothetical protein
MSEANREKGWDEAGSKATSGRLLVSYVRGGILLLLSLRTSLRLTFTPIIMRRKMQMES